MANQSEVKQALDELWGRYGKSLELLLDTLDKLDEKPTEVEVEKIVEVEADIDIDLSTPARIAELESQVLGRTQTHEGA
jgi:hypothetical protein